MRPKAQKDAGRVREPLYREVPGLREDHAAHPINQI